MNNADWFGQLPEGWRVVKLKRLLRLCDEKTTSEGGVLLSLSQYKGVYPNEGQGRAASTIGYNVVKRGQFVMNIMLAWNGSYAVSDYDGIISPSYCVFEFIADCDKKYVGNLLKIDEYQKLFEGVSTGVVRSRLRLYPYKFLQFFLPLPPLSDQHRISRWLDAHTKALDALVRSNARRVSALRELRQAEVVRCVTRGLDPMARMVKCGNDWVDEMPEGWKVVKLKRLGAMNKGLSITKANLVAEGEPVISYGQIHAKFNTGTAIDDTLIRHVPKAITSTAARSLACKGDFIFADTSEDMAGCGNAVFVDGEREVYGGYHTIVLHTGNNGSKYLAYLFRSDEWRHQIRTRVGGIKVYSITQTVLSQCEVILPPLAEQYRIATHLDKYTSAVDRLVANLQRQNELLGELRRRLIADAVLGKIAITD